MSAWALSDTRDPLTISKVIPRESGVVEVGAIEENRFSLRAVGKGVARVQVGSGGGLSNGFEVSVVKVAETRGALFAARDWPEALTAGGHVALSGASVLLVAEHADAEGEVLTGDGLVDWRLESGACADVEARPDVPGEIAEITMGGCAVVVSVGAQRIEIGAAGIGDVARLVLHVPGTGVFDGSAPIEVNLYERKVFEVVALTRDGASVVGRGESAPGVGVSLGASHLDVAPSDVFSGRGAFDGLVSDRGAAFSVYAIDSAGGELEVSWLGRTLRVAVVVRR